MTKYDYDLFDGASEDELRALAGEDPAEHLKAMKHMDPSEILAAIEEQGLADTEFVSDGEIEYLRELAGIEDPTPTDAESDGEEPVGGA